jgi:hypothetical protein
MLTACGILNQVIFMCMFGFFVLEVIMRDLAHFFKFLRTHNQGQVAEKRKKIRGNIHFESIDTCRCRFVRFCTWLCDFMPKAWQFAMYIADIARPFRDQIDSWLYFLKWLFKFYRATCLSPGQSPIFFSLKYYFLKLRNRFNCFTAYCIFASAAPAGAAKPDTPAVQIA